MANALAEYLRSRFDEHSDTVKRIVSNMPDAELVAEWRHHHAYSVKRNKLLALRDKDYKPKPRPKAITFSADVVEAANKFIYYWNKVH